MRRQYGRLATRSLLCWSRGGLPSFALALFSCDWLVGISVSRSYFVRTRLSHWLLSHCSCAWAAPTLCCFGAPTISTSMALHCLVRRYLTESPEVESFLPAEYFTQLREFLIILRNRKEFPRLIRRHLDYGL